MKKISILVLSVLFLASCSNKKNLIYLNDSNKNNINKIDYSKLYNNIEIGDILKIDVQTDLPEASTPYNKIINSVSNEAMLFDGYLVSENYSINFPILGDISVLKINEEILAKKITRLLIENGHLSNPFVRVRKINSKFTILGEVKTPGTFPIYEKNINIFQALGYAGDLTINGERDNITLIREGNGLRKTYKLSINDSEILQKPYYFIKNNDIIIVEPNFSKVKSAGFIGSPNSIASIASLLLSITLLIINK
tara:strand:- start:464 stop:1222 length:759 start_codon:yes stop_codon:yes gene_type:complete